MLSKAEISRATQHLCQVDSLLSTVIAKQPLLPVIQPTPLLLALLQSIVHQQLSIKAAATIWTRFEALFDGPITAPGLLEINDETLRSAGLSRRKVEYVNAVANFAIIDQLDDRLINRLSDEEVIDHLVQIKGVGRWTAEMVLMSSLGRLDIFPVDDLGVQQGMQRLYGLSEEAKTLKRQMREVAESWRPFRSVASRYIWQSLNNGFI